MRGGDKYNEKNEVDYSDIFNLCYGEWRDFFCEQTSRRIKGKKSGYSRKGGNRGGG